MSIYSIKVVAVKSCATDETIESAIIMRQKNGESNDAFFLSNDGTIQVCGGIPYYLTTANPSIGHACSWNLGNYDNINVVVEAWNAGELVEPNDSFGGTYLEVISEGDFDTNVGVLDLASKLGTPHILSMGIDDYVAGRVAAGAGSSSRAAIDTKFVSEKYEDGVIYEGMQSYHDHHGSALNRPMGEWSGARIGVELEIVANNRPDYDKLCAIPSNWFFKESDSSLDSYGIEFITVPLLPADAKSVEFWSPLMDTLKRRAKSWSKSCCGLHIHIGREAFGDTPSEQSATIGKLLYFYHHCILDDESAKSLNYKIYGRSYGYHEESGRTCEGSAVKVLGKEVLKSKSICDKVGKAMTDHSSGGRYFDINITNTPTVEFRKGKGSICAERIVAVIDWCESMVRYCRATEWEAIDFDAFITSVRESKETTSSLRSFLMEDL